MYKDKGTTRTKDYPVQNVGKVKIENHWGRGKEITMKP